VESLDGTLPEQCERRRQSSGSRVVSVRSAPLRSQAAIRVEEDRQVALRQDGQELPEPPGGTLIKSALPSDPGAVARRHLGHPWQQQKSLARFGPLRVGAQALWDRRSQQSQPPEGSKAPRPHNA
jgi:hypothetical protein